MSLSLPSASPYPSSPKSAKAESAPKAGAAPTAGATGSNASPTAAGKNNAAGGKADPNGATGGSPSTDPKAVIQQILSMMQAMLSQLGGGSPDKAQNAAQTPQSGGSGKGENAAQGAGKGGKPDKAGQEGGGSCPGKSGKGENAAQGSDKGGKGENAAQGAGKSGKDEKAGEEGGGSCPGKAGKGGKGDNAAQDYGKGGKSENAAQGGESADGKKGGGQCPGSKSGQDSTAKGDGAQGETPASGSNSASPKGSADGAQQPSGNQKSGEQKPSGNQQGGSQKAGTGPNSTGQVNGGGSKELVLQNNEDKPIKIGLMENTGPGMNPNIDDPNNVFELQPGETKKLSMPESWQGRAQKLGGKANDPATWAEINFENKNGQDKIWYDDSVIRGYNSAVTMAPTDGSGPTKGHSNSILANAPQDAKTTDSAGNQVIKDVETYQGGVNKSAEDYLNQAIGKQNAYVRHDDNSAVGTTDSKSLTVAFNPA